jgi:hypothetical protein
MAEHDIKANIVQVNRILSKEQAAIVVQNILSYSDTFELPGDTDLVYKKWVLDLIDSIGIGSMQFAGQFLTMDDLLAYPTADLADGAYAFVGVSPNFAIYFWDGISEVFVTINGLQGPAGPAGQDGADGADGAPGTSVTILGSVATENELPANGTAGDGYLIGDDLYVWDFLLEDWKNVGPIRGPVGPAGPAGAPGANGTNGTDGVQGLTGPIGASGKSAYEVAVINGFVGTATEWLDSLIGPLGASAYDIAVLNGFSGTEQQWLLSLIGPGGKSAYDVAVLNGFIGTISQWLVSLVGPQGPAGPAGGGDKNREFVITEASTVWTLAHFLDKKPGFTALDSEGNPIYPVPSWPDQNTMLLTLPFSSSGFVVLN